MHRRRLSILALVPLMFGSAALAQQPKAARAPSKSPLPGQIVVDPDHPQWLKRYGGRHVFICGPGDPEDFLYVGRRKPDGTRDGDQVARIEKLAEHGGNCVYMQIVRSHGGDAKKNGDPDWERQNPFVDGNPARGLDEDILEQWEEWFTRMDRHEILMYLFFYDDSARIWNTGDAVGPEEQVFLETIVKRFQHHKNLIWVIGEESEERYTTARVQAIAEIIKHADDHGHVIGNHHLTGTTFKAWQPGGALNHFAMQLGKTGDEAHAGAIEALAKAAGRYQIIYAENTATPTNVLDWRRYAWSISMTGTMPMLMRMDIASTPVEMLEQFRHLQEFFEATDFWTLSSHDELKHDGTKYVLADPGRSYVAYTDNLTSQIGIKRLPAGQYAVTWLDCQTGQTVTRAVHVDQPGDHAFDKPQPIGAECAAWIRRAARETVLIEDSLQGKTKGQQVGGAFGPEGYLPGLGQNHILYELPRTVREGYIEFEVKGMDAAAVPKDGDHGFLGMYDGRGVAEPAQYFRDLKSNFYRWNVHWRQNRHAMKCVISCAAPSAEREKAAMAQYGEKRDWTKEPMGRTVQWDPARWHQLRVEWQGKTFRVLVDGIENWRAEGPYDYAPVNHRIWLGSAPASGDKYPCMIKDIVYRNFKVVTFSEAESKPAKEHSAIQPPPAANRAPVAESRNVTTSPDVQTFIQLTFEDEDGPGPYSYTLVRAPEQGTLTGDDNDRFYTPNAGFIGIDQFAWKVNDGQADSRVVSVTICVRAFDDDPREKAIYFPPPGETPDAQDRRTPQEVGLKPEVIDRLREQPLGGLWALWRHGYLVHVEGDFNKPVEVKSLRKSWHALTVGAAVRQGKVPSLDQKVSVWNKELTGKDADATWRHLITQTSGFDYPFGNQPAYKPGEIWTYSDKNPHQLCNALARVYGKQDYHDNYQDVVGPALFDAIGMRGWKTSIREDGVRFHFDLEDMGRLGLLVLARGRWAGQQIVPQEFVEALETKQTRGIRPDYDGPDDGGVGGGWLREHHENSRECPYGYMTWVNTDGDLFPGTDRAWAQGSGAGGSAVLWNCRHGIVFVGLGVDTRRGTGGIPHDIEACIAGPNPLLSR